MSSNNNNNNNGFDASGFTYGLAFVGGLIFLLAAISFACLRLSLTQTPNNIHNILAGFRSSQVAMEQQHHHHHHVVQINTSFQGYPELLYSEELLKNRDGSRVSSVCSICLGDYKESDMLRMLPDCGHVFHQACVDPWLMLHSTCPICRKSSIQGSSNSASNFGE